MDAVQYREVAIQQVLAMRAQCDALLAMLGVRPEDGSDIAPACTHPPEKRRIETVMGGPERWQCQACGYEYDESQPGDGA